MSKTLGSSIVLCLFLSGFFVASSASAEALGFFKVRRLLSQADEALATGRHDEAAELYNQVVKGTKAGKRHARAHLGVAVAELNRNKGKESVVRRHLNAYLADPATSEEAVARAMQKLLARMGSARAAAKPKPAPPKPSPAAPDAETVDAEEPDDSAERIAALEQQLAAAKKEIEEKEKVIEDLRKIVVEGDG
ncbi:MAG: hypothetical protein MPN21_21635 [Thermoanaerobaculia bacterium]|nr:hypothetical protein [Thermoanaerobaculia bacterium]